MTPRVWWVPALFPVLVAACGAPAKPDSTTPAPTAPAPAADAAPATPATPAAPPVTAKATKVRTVEGITEYQLDNGLSVLLFPDASQSNVTVDVTYKVGSRFEGYGETGMAHLLEHMMFKGSPRIANPSKALEARGGQNNASTWDDRTNYFETLPATQDNLDFALDMEADRMINAKIAAEDLKSEFSVVRNEFERDEDSPGDILSERIGESAFLWHNYGHPTIGSRVDIERVPVPALHAFYTKYYQPDNAVLTVAGKFDEAATLASIGKTFGALQRPTRVLQATYTVEPVQDGERRVTLSRSGDVSVVAVAFHAVNGASPDFAAFEAAADVLTREPSGRLYKKLVETKLAANVDGGLRAMHDPGLISFSATVRDPKNVDKVEQILLAEIDGLATSKIDDKDIERWKVSENKEQELAMTNSQRIALRLTEDIAVGDWRVLFAHRDSVNGVTAADIQRIAKEYFRPSNRTVGRFVPTKDPQRAPFTEGTPVVDYVKNVKGGAAMEEGEVFAGTFDNIDSRTQRGELKGGIKTALLPKKTRGGKVQLELHLHWGDEKALQGKSTAADLLGSLMERGTKKKSYQDIEDLEDVLKAHISISTSADGLTLHIDTLRDKLAPAFDLAAEILTTPTFPQAQLELVKQEELAGLEQQLQDPQAVGFNTFRQTLSQWPKGDPRRAESTQEQIDAIKKISAGEIGAFYREFVGAGHGELIVIGDFDPKAVSAQVEALTSTWVSKKPYKRLDDKVFGVPAATKSVDLKDKENSLLIMGEDFSMHDSDPDYAALQVANQILGAGEGSRLWTRVREKEGLSYGVGSQVSAGALDDAGAFFAYAIMAPQNVDKVKTSMLDEITKIASGGAVSADELAHAKDTWIKELDTNLGNDRYVSAMLENQTFRGRTMDFSRKLRAGVQAVTADDVAKAAKAHLTPARLVIVDAGDKSKAAASK